MTLKIVMPPQPRESRIPFSFSSFSGRTYNQIQFFHLHPSRYAKGAEAFISSVAFWFIVELNCKMN